MTGDAWLLLLRGINVGRGKRVAMAELRALLGDLGYSQVRTVLQSGNVVLRGPGPAETVECRVAGLLREALGLDVAVLVRPAADLPAIVSANPFVEAGVEPKELHVTFLSSPPAAGVLDGIDREALSPDAFEVGDRLLYEHRPKGVLASRLPDWQDVLGQPVTARSWGTVTTLAALAPA